MALIHTGEIIRKGSITPGTCGAELRIELTALAGQAALNHRAISRPGVLTEWLQ